MSLEEAMNNAEVLLEQTAKNVIKVYLRSLNKQKC
jgi:hypothetical protein